EIVNKAVEKGLDVIAVVDHDTMAHAAHIPADAGIHAMAGIEISTVHRETGTRAHILGYDIKKVERVTALTQPLLEARNKNSERQAGILMEAGYSIDLDRIKRADGKYLYKGHIVDWLLSTGQIADMFGEFYQKTFGQGGICASKIEYIDVFEAVRAIKEAGGLAVLAHPGQQRNFFLIPSLAEAGLAGLELNHYANSAGDRETISENADRYGLFMTGGSDYHGKYGRQPYGIGDILCHNSGVDGILKRKSI
ncbi:MAG: phosphatase, partial [Oscillospiraceae bacterium]|nr:phosphatase [Oscillospiraceae bacterium]